LNFVEIAAANAAKSGAIIAAKQIGRQIQQQFGADIFGYINGIFVVYFDKKLDIVGDLAFKMIRPENMEAITKIGWMYLIIFIIGVLLYNVYFIDTVLTAIPLGYLIYMLYGEFLTFQPAVFAVLAGWLILKETMTQQETLGCVLMFIAVILSQIPVKHKIKEAPYN
jgi:drug/metabolite transporter (DMT)-like permease